MPEGQVLLLFGIFIFLEIKSLKGNICRNFLDGKYIFVQQQMEVGNGFWLKVFYLVGIYIFNLCLKNENKVASAKACYIEFSKNIYFSVECDKQLHISWNNYCIFDIMQKIDLSTAEFRLVYYSFTADF